MAFNAIDKRVAMYAGVQGETQHRVSNDPVACPTFTWCTRKPLYNRLVCSAAKFLLIGSCGVQRRFLVCVMACFVWAVGSVPIHAQEANVPIASSDWLATFGLDDQLYDVVESDHFALATDVDHADTGLWLEQLELTYVSVERFSKSLKLSFAVPSSKLRVIVFASDDELQLFADRSNIAIQQSNGLYIVESHVSVFVDAASHPLLGRVGEQIKSLQDVLDQMGDKATEPIDQQRRNEVRQKIAQLQQRRDRLTLRFNQVVLRHEAAHQVFYNAGIHDDKLFDPLWLREGLACLFEPTANNKVDVPINRSRLYDLPWLRLLRSANPGQDITAYNARLSMAARSCLDSTLAMLSDDEFLSAIHEDAAQRYAQAWAFVYYLSKRFPEAFAKYVQHADTTMSFDQNTPANRLKAFETRFGKMDEKFCTHWLQYLATKRLDRDPASR